MKEEALAIGSRLLRLVTCLLCGHGMMFCGPSLGSLDLCGSQLVLLGVLRYRFILRGHSDSQGICLCNRKATSKEALGGSSLWERLIERLSWSKPTGPIQSPRRDRDERARVSLQLPLVNPRARLFVSLLTSSSHSTPSAFSKEQPAS